MILIITLHIIFYSKYHINCTIWAGLWKNTSNCFRNNFVKTLRNESEIKTQLPYIQVLNILISFSNIQAKQYMYILDFHEDMHLLQVDLIVIL